MKIRGKVMVDEKRSPAQLMATDRTQRFALGEKGSAIVDANKERKTALAASRFKESRLQELADPYDADIPLSSALFLDFRTSFAQFVETKFIPEHVQYKTRAGQIHYQAMLKHVITPEVVSRFFNAENDVHARLRAIPDWPYLDATRLCDLSPEHIRRIVAAANGAGYSAQTVKHIKNVCFAIIAHAQKEGCFNGPNPASLVKLPKLTRSTLPSLSACQAKSILDLLHYPHREAALFALTTTMSLPEICDLRWKHVNLGQSEQVADGRRIRARAILANALWNPAGLGDGAASSKCKLVDIREPLLSTLRELRKRRPIPDPEDLVLRSEMGEKMIPAGFWGNELKRVAKVLGMSRLSWQDLRRGHQALSTELWTQSPRSSLWSSVDPCTSHLGKETSMRREVHEEYFRSEPKIQRRLCFGRRLRGSQEAGAQPYWQSQF